MEDDLERFFSEETNRRWTLPYRGTLIHFEGCESVDGIVSKAQSFWQEACEQNKAASSQRIKVTIL